MDTDTSKRIHFTAMFRYFEAAEQEFLRSLGFTNITLRDLGVDIPRVRAECSYRALLKFDDLVEIQVDVERVGNSSVTLVYTARREDGVVAAEGKVVFCAVDMKTGRSTPLPEKLRTALTGCRRTS